jgi:type III pantothenate kinase
MPDDQLTLIGVCVGNTNTQIGLVEAGKVSQRTSRPSADAPGIADAIASLAHDTDVTTPQRAIVVATVNLRASTAIETELRNRLDAGASAEWGIYLIGRDLNLPMQGRLDPEAVTGQDRILTALAAYDTMKQACIVVDAGTAITVDFVDGEGVFHGGAIAPGLRMSLRALHEHTAALPEIEFRKPDADATFGRNTVQAMYQGVYHAARGLVRTLAERYAEAYGAYPPIVATGGDAHTLFDDDELVDRIADDLVLRGIMVACRKSLAGIQAEDRDEE